MLCRVDHCKDDASVSGLGGREPLKNSRCCVYFASWVPMAAIKGKNVTRKMSLRKTEILEVF